MKIFNMKFVIQKIHNTTISRSMVYHVILTSNIVLMYDISHSQSILLSTSLQSVGSYIVVDVMIDTLF